MDIFLILLVAGYLLNCIAFIGIFYIVFHLAQDSFVHAKIMHKTTESNPVKQIASAVQLAIEIAVPFAHFIRLSMVVKKLKESNHMSLREQYRILERLDHKLDFFKFIKD